MKAEFKGILKKVNQLEQYGNTKIARLEILEMARLDAFGEKIGKDQVHQISAINRTIEKLPENVISAIATTSVNIDEGGKCEVLVYINSRSYEYEGAQRYSCEMALADIKFIK